MRSSDSADSFSEYQMIELIIRHFFLTALFGIRRVADLIRHERIPQDAVGHHPTVGKKNIRAELNSHQLVIHLHHDALDPAAYAFTVLLVIAEDLDRIAHLKFVFRSGCIHISELRLSAAKDATLCRSQWRILRLDFYFRLGTRNRFCKRSRFQGRNRNRQWRPHCDCCSFHCRLRSFLHSLFFDHRLHNLLCFYILWFSIQLLCICLRLFFRSHCFNPFSPKLPAGIFP